MKHRRENLYEGMYLISSTLSEDARKKALDKIVDGITEKGGKIEKIHEMGRRRLAYRINRRKDGYYYLIYFSVLTSAIAELWKEYHLHEDLMRFIILKAETVLEELEFKPLEKVK